MPAPRKRLDLRPGLALTAPLLILSHLAAPHFARADAGASDPSATNLPQGPGSIEGFGQGYELAPARATPSLRYEFELLPARGDERPALALTHAPGAGVGVVGLDWELDLPRIEVSTRDGLPRPGDQRQLVLRGLPGGGDLVEVAPGRYRLEHETHARYHVSARSDGGFDVFAVDGARWTLGDQEVAREPGATGTFRWLATAKRDAVGNVSSFEWRVDPDDTTDVPVLEAITWADGAAEVRFSYESRPDPIVHVSGGRRSLLGVRMSGIDTRFEGEDVRHHALEYASTPALPSSRLVAIHGWAADGTRLPKWQMTYTGASLDGGADGPKPRELGAVTGLDPQGPGRALVDVDADGAVDLLDASQAGAWRWRKNAGGMGFTEWSALPMSPSVALDTPGLARRWMDVDGDGASDLVVQVGSAGDLRAFLGGVGSDASPREPFATVVDVSATIGVQLDDPSVAATDLDLDGRVDLLRVSGHDAWWWRADPDGVGFLPAQPVNAPTAGFAPGDPGVSLLDLDGDRLADAVRPDLATGEIAVAWGLGHGEFELPELLAGMPTVDASADLRLRDINGDGTTDLLVIGQSRVDAWTNVGGREFVALRGFDWPTLAPNEAVAIADVDANGTLDLLRVDPGSSAWTVWPLLDERAGLIRRFENGLGYAIDFHYDTAAAVAHRAGERGDPWIRHTPVAETVLVRSEATDAAGWSRVVEVDVRDPYWSREDLASRGYAEVRQRRRGDEYSASNAVVRRYHLGEGDGAHDDALEGLLLEETTYTEGDAAGGDGSPVALRRVAQDFDVRPLAPGVSAARRGAVDTWYLEGGEEVDAVRERETFGYDDWGNVVEHHRWGRVDPLTGLDDGHEGDEQIVRTTYASPGDDEATGPRDRPAEVLTLDGGGAVVTATRTFYDGAAGEGLALGELNRGLPSLERTWVADERWLTAARRGFDDYGHLTWTTDGEGGRVEQRYDEHGLHVVEERFELDGRSEVDALIRTTTWDPGLGVPVEVTDPAGAVWMARYDGLGRMTALIAPGDDEEAPTVRHVYHLDGEVAPTVSTLQRVDDDTVQMRVDHLDGLGRLRSRVSQDDEGHGAALVRAVRYDAEGNEAGVLEGAWLDASALMPGGGLDPVAWAQLLPQARATVTTRDALGRPTKIVDAEGRTSTRQYAPGVVIARDPGDLTGEDGYSDAPRLAYSDGQGHLTRIVDTIGGRAIEHRYEWDAAGRLTAHVDPEGWRSAYVHDGAGRLIEVDSPDAGIIEREYDDANRLVLNLDARGAVVVHDYDALGRPLRTEAIGIDGELESAVTYIWDKNGEGAEDVKREPVGRLARVEDAAGSVAFAYDARGREVRRTRTFDRAGGGSLTLSYARVYDGADRVVQEIFPDGGRVTRTYGARGLERSVGAFVPHIEHDARGRWIRMQLGDATSMQRTLDETGNVTSLRAQGDERLVDLTYDYDVLGRLRGTTDHLGALDHSPALDQRFEHDDLGRLVSANGAYGSQTWSYADAGNLIEHDGQSVAYGDGGTAGPHAATAFGGQRLRYDAAGQLVEVTGEGAIEVGGIGWDAQGRVVTTTAADGARSESVYDHEGQRAIRRDYAPDGALREEVFYFGPEVEVRGDELVRWIFAGGQRIAASPTDVPDDGYPALPLVGGLVAPLGVRRARTDDVRREQRRRRRARALPALLVLFAGMAGGCSAKRGSKVNIHEMDLDARTRFFVQDRLGSAAVVVNRDGEAVARVGQRAYGERWFSWTAKGEQLPDYGFTDAETDPVAGTMYMGARHYVPQLGRWASPDPLFTVEDPTYALERVGERNPYRYAGNDPVDSIDPSGLAEVPVTVTGSVNVGLSLALSLTKTVDDDGNVAVSVSGGVGVALLKSVGVDVSTGVVDSDHITEGWTTSVDVDLQVGAVNAEYSRNLSERTVLGSGDSLKGGAGSGMGAPANLSARLTATYTKKIENPTLQRVIKSSPEGLVQRVAAVAAAQELGY